MKYGYVKDGGKGISYIDKQKLALGEVDVFVIATDKSELQSLVDKVERGDSIHVSDMSVISRKIDECFSTYNILSRKGVELYVNGELFKPTSPLASV